MTQVVTAGVFRVWPDGPGGEDAQPAVSPELERPGAFGGAAHLLEGRPWVWPGRAGLAVGSLDRPVLGVAPSAWLRSEPIRVGSRRCPPPASRARSWSVSWVAVGLRRAAFCAPSNNRQRRFRNYSSGITSNPRAYKARSRRCIVRGSPGSTESGCVTCQIAGPSRVTW
jgi:hypothetical protein